MISAVNLPVWVTVFGSVCSGLCIFTILAPALILVYASLRRVGRVYQKLMDEWASENGLRIIHQERRILKHPWILLPIRNQQIYYVTVEYRDGRPFFRHAWIRCGGWYWHLDSAKLEFTWDERVPQPLPPPQREDGAPRVDPLWDPWLDS
jgi:hypothetical protein